MIKKIIQACAALPKFLVILSAVVLVFIFCVVGFFARGHQSDPPATESPQSVNVDPSSDQARRASERALDEDEAIRNRLPSSAAEQIKQIEAAIAQFQETEGRFPRDLDELVRTEYLIELPSPPTGTKYFFVPNSGEFGVIED